VTAGQVANFNLQLTPGAGFAGSASFVCVGAPAAATCTAPSVQISGVSVTYVVSVATTANGMAVFPTPLPFLPQIRSSRVWTLPVWCGLLALLFYISNSQSRGNASLLRVAALAVLASLCVFEIAGCGGAGASASPQIVPVHQITGTPTGTSLITLTPSVTTSTGTPLTGIPPVQLTLIVQ
jgi:hypothetical protein